MKPACVVVLIPLLAVCALAQRPPAAVYLLAPNDVVVIRAMEADELSDKPFRIDPDGFVNLPLAGRMQAAGLTVEQFEAALTDVLKKIIKDPQVSVNVVERAKSAELRQGVSLAGAFKSPGIYSIGSDETVLDVIARAGGLAPGANRRLHLQRRAQQGPIPLAAAVRDADGRGMSVDILLSPTFGLVNPDENIELKPSDVLSAARLELVYGTGALGRTGGFPLEDRETYSVAQFVSVCGGLGRDADAARALILRPVPGSARREAIPVDVRAILAGRAADAALRPNDILVVPRKGGRLNAVSRTLLYAVPGLVTSLVYVALR